MPDPKMTDAELIALAAVVASNRAGFEVFNAIRASEGYALGYTEADFLNDPPKVALEEELERRGVLS